MSNTPNKAAYYTGSDYSTYANGTNVAPIGGVNTNYMFTNRPWDIGTGTIEQNGTFDMMGNVWEWSETLLNPNISIIRGGAFVNIDYNLSSSGRLFNTGPNFEGYAIGFRVASVPEPATILLFGLGGLVLRRRKK